MLTLEIPYYVRFFQEKLFPFLEERIGKLTEKHKELLSILELIKVETYISVKYRQVGNQEYDRAAMARFFIAKKMYNFSITKDFIEIVRNDRQLRTICGFSEGVLPSESTFSRAFKEFSKIGLPEKLQEMVVKRTLNTKLIGHISRDSTAIQVDEKSKRKKKEDIEIKVKKKRGRLKKGEIKTPKDPTRLERQGKMTLEEMIAELPKECDFGTKKNSKGKVEHWKGGKLHIDWADGEIPISCVYTSASVHDSQAAIPLSLITASRVTSLYDLMDAAYDSEEIRKQSKALGHIPIIDSNKRKGKVKEISPAEKIRYNERTTAERGNSLLKERFGIRKILVKGCKKVFAELMFAILALTAKRVLNLASI